MFRRYTFWLTLFAVVMDLLNYLDIDDNVFLYLTSPPSWFIEPFLAVIPKDIKIGIIYVANIIFWFIAGRYIDHLFEKRNRRNAE